MHIEFSLKNPSLHFFHISFFWPRNAAASLNHEIESCGIIHILFIAAAVFVDKTTHKHVLSDLLLSLAEAISIIFKPEE